MRVALVSLNQAWQAKQENLARCTDAVKTLAGLNVDLIIFPEMTLTAFAVASADLLEEESSSWTIQAFKEVAKTYRQNIMFGVNLRGPEGKGLNTLYCVDEQGKALSRYVKMHPFSFADEDKYFSSGDRPVVSRVQDAVIGNSICYDLRFPELYRAYASRVNVLVNVANWPAKRIAHWYSLLQARAIENVCFMAGINRTGIDGNELAYEKSSCIFNPAGERLEPVFNSGDIDIYELDVSSVATARSQFPALNDRKESISYE